MKNETMRFIDSCVGNIARKIEDEFNEQDHPRDKGGKFTSAGKESRKASGMYGGENVKKEDPKRGDALNEHAVKLEKAGADPKEVHRLNREGDLEGMKKLLEETEAEKSAKEELSEHERKLEAIKKDDEEFNKMSNELLDIASDLDTANDALRALGWDNDYDDLEQAHEALKEAIRRDPETAKELLENTHGRDEEDEEVKAGKETDKIVEAFKGSGIDMYAAMADLGLDVHRIPEGHLEGVFEERLFNSPKFRQQAKQYISEYRRTDPDEEEDWFK